MNNYSFHPLSELFPLMNEKKIRELGKDIQENGLLEEIELYEGMILDGRNRYLACKMFSIPPKFKKFSNTMDPLLYVVSKNLKRRHLNSAQLCEIGLKLLEIEKKKAKRRQIRTRFTSKKEKPHKKSPNMVINPELPTIDDSKKGRAIDIVASKLKVSPNTLRKAIKIKEIARKDSTIRYQWEKAKNNEVSIKSVYQSLKKNSIKPTLSNTIKSHKMSLESQISKDIEQKVVFSSERESIKYCRNCIKSESIRCVGCGLNNIICHKYKNGIVKDYNSLACEEFEV